MGDRVEQHQRPGKLTVFSSQEIIADSLSAVRGEKTQVRGDMIPSPGKFALKVSATARASSQQSLLVRKEQVDSQSSDRARNEALRPTRDKYVDW